MKVKVVSRGKIREGKGFSLKEIEKAGLTIKDVKGLVRIDKRRKTCYDFNVELLKGLIKKKKEKKKAISIREIKGVGKKRAEALESAGIKTVEDLIKADIGKLSEKTKISEKLLKKYIEEAKKLR
ncbi:MAG: hypothetical protein DRN95_04135 [Candidatus Hydrothermarchaeota archaeon]|nr:MAG: hypothetical protein DRN95_04135 [Candidatus Hydrothermarchaeota archaeon]